MYVPVSPSALKLQNVESAIVERDTSRSLVEARERQRLVIRQQTRVRTTCSFPLIVAIPDCKTLAVSTALVSLQGDLSEEQESRLKQLLLVRKIYEKMLAVKVREQSPSTSVWFPVAPSVISPHVVVADAPHRPGCA